MKILTLNANLREVGTYRRCFHFSRVLASRGHDVTMVTVARDSKYRPRIVYKSSFAEDHEVPAGAGPWVRMIEGPRLGYKWIPGWGSGPLDIAGRFRRIIAERYDVVYGFEYHPNVSWPVYAALPFRSFAFYSDWCDWYGGSSNHLGGWRFAQRIDRYLEERIRFLARKVTVTSKVLEQRALSIGIPPENVVRIPEGEDTDYCRPLPADATRRDLGYTVGRPIVMAVNDGDMKRVVGIFRLVLREIPESLLVVVGKVQEPAQALVAEMGIAGAVQFAGWVDVRDYPRHLACADLGIVPLEDTLNNRARWPAKILDFLATGCPVVTNDVGEAGDLLRGSDVGVLAGFSDADLARETVGLLRDEGRRADLGRRARTVMLEEWDWRHRADAISGLVEH